MHSSKQVDCSLWKSTHLECDDGNLANGEGEITLRPVLLVNPGQELLEMVLAEGLTIQLAVLAVYRMRLCKLLAC